MGNRGPSHNGYKILCLQMPLFWFMSFNNGIKIIRDNTFCFDVRLGPNPCTWHTSHIHGARCNSKELCGIRMSEVPPLLLGKRATTGSLSQNLFCHLQTNSEWLTILESLKKKKKQTRALFELTQQTTKGYGLYDVHLGLFPQTSLGDSLLLSSSFLSLPSLARHFPQVNLGLFLYLYLYNFHRACMFNSLRICARVILTVGSTRGGENSLRTRYVWGGIFYLFHDLLGDEKLAE